MRYALLRTVENVKKGSDAPQASPPPLFRSKIFLILSNVLKIGKNLMLYKVKYWGVIHSNSFQFLQDWKVLVIFVANYQAYE